MCLVGRETPSNRPFRRGRPRRQNFKQRPSRERASHPGASWAQFSRPLPPLNRSHDGMLEIIPLRRPRTIRRWERVFPDLSYALWRSPGRSRALHRHRWPLFALWFFARTATQAFSARPNFFSVAVPQTMVGKARHPALFDSCR